MTVYAPYLIYPASNEVVNATATIRFSWEFLADDFTSGQAGFEFRRREAGAGNWWPTVVVSSPQRYYDTPGGTFTVGDWEWQLRTRDNTGTYGPWAASGFFTAATPVTTHQFTAPTAGATVPSLDFAWSTPDQDAYELTIFDNDFGTYFTSGTVVNPGARTLSVPLTALAKSINGFAVTASLRIRVDGLWSDWTRVYFTVHYTPPPLPAIFVTEGEPVRAIGVTVINPDPVGTQPRAVRNVLYRRVATGRDEAGNPTFTGPGEVIPLRPAGDFLPNTTVVDWSVASSQQYEYTVLVEGDNGATRMAPWPSEAIVETIDNVLPPVITGSARQGGTLNGAPGEWTGTPVAYVYQWQKSTVATEPVTITATGAAPPIQLVDPVSGATYDVTVTANLSGGGTLTAEPDTRFTASGTMPTPTGWVDIADAISPTFVLTTAEVGAMLRLLVRAQAEDGNWTEPFPSAQVGPVVTTATDFAIVLYADNKRTNPQLLDRQVVGDTAYADISPWDGVTAVRWWDIGHTTYRRPSWASSSDPGYASAVQGAHTREDTAPPFDAHAGGTATLPEAVGPDLSDIGTSAPTSRTWYAEVDAGGTTHQVKAVITIHNPTTGGVSSFPFKRVLGTVAFHPREVASREPFYGREIDKVSIYAGQTDAGHVVSSIRNQLQAWAADPMSNGTKRTILIARYLGATGLTLPQTASGANNSNIQAVANACAEHYGDDLDKLIFCTHEANYVHQPETARSDSGKVGANVTNFRSAFKQYVTVFRNRLTTLGLDASKVKFALSPGLGSFAEASTARGVGFGGEHFLTWPGDDFCDYFGGNLYDNRGQPNTPNTAAFRTKSLAVSKSQLETYLRPFADADPGNPYVEAANTAAGAANGGRSVAVPMLMMEWSLMLGAQPPPRVGGGDHPEWITMHHSFWKGEHAKPLLGRQITLGRRIVGLWHFDRNPSKNGVTDLYCKITGGEKFPAAWAEFRRTDRWGGGI